MTGALKVRTSTSPDVWTVIGGGSFATDEEVIAGVVDDKAVTPAGLAAYGAARDVMWVGTDEPTDPNIEMWWDPDESSLTAAYLDVRAFGVVGDGVADDTTAMQTAITTAATAKLPLIITPGAYKITVPLDVPSNSRIRGTAGAKLVNNCPGAGDRLLRIVGAVDVIVEGLELDGAKAAYGTVTEHRHNIGIINSDYVTLRDVYSHDAKGDGIYVGDDNTSANYCTHVVLEGCRAIANHRNNLSVVAVDDFKATDCVFLNATGTNPQSGVGVEPNAGTTVCNDIKFVNCTMTGNVGAAAYVAFHMTPTAQQRSVTFTGCEMSFSTDAALGAGLRVRNPNDVRVIGCQLRNNAAQGIYLDTQGGFISGGLTIANCNVSTNGLDGIQVFNIALAVNLVIIGCEFNGNSTVTPNTLDGISLTPSAVATDFQIIGCWFDGATQRYGIRTQPNAQKVTIIGNRYGTMGTGAVSLGDEQASRFRAEQAEVFMAAAAAATNVLRVRTGTDVNDRLAIRADGEIRIGDGAIAPDIRLFRNGANQLRTAGDMVAGKLWSLGEVEIDGAFNHDGTTVGFYNTTPIAKQTGVAVTIAAVHAALVALGLIGA